MSNDTLQLALEALEASIDDVRECLDNLRPHSGWAKYDRRIEAYQAQIERHELAIEGIKAMMEQPAPAQPTKEEIRQAFDAHDARFPLVSSMWSFEAGIEFAEKHYGITKGSE